MVVAATRVRHIDGFPSLEQRVESDVLLDLVVVVFVVVFAALRLA